MSKIVLAFLFTLAPTLAFADGSSDEWAVRPTPTLEVGSGAAFDKRLPPVFPGEEVKTGNKTMSVWSSSGPVPVAQPPEPWKSREESKIGSVGVIVDQRNPAALATPVPTP